MEHHVLPPAEGVEGSRMGRPWERISWQGRKQRSNGRGHRQDATGVSVVPDLSMMQLRLVSPLGRDFSTYKASSQYSR